MNIIRNRKCFVLGAIVILSLSAADPRSALAQRTGPEVIYRERGYPISVNTTPTMLNGSGSLMFDVSGRGIYVVDTVTWNARHISEIDNMSNYQYSVILRRPTGGLSCLQSGNAGIRLWKFDESLNVVSDTLPARIDTVSGFYFGNKYSKSSTLWLPINILTPPIVSRRLLTFDGCDTWVDLPQDQGVVFLNVDGHGGYLSRSNGSGHYAILHPFTQQVGSRTPVNTPINAAPNVTASETSEYFTVAFYERDTIIWIDEVKGKMVLGIGALGDTVASFLASSLKTADGRSIRIVNQRCHLMYSATRRAFLVDSAGAIHEYRKGLWHTVDTVRHKHPFYPVPIFSSETAYYYAKLSDGRLGKVFLHLKDSIEQELRVNEYDDRYNNVRPLPNVHPALTPSNLSWNGQMVLTMKSGRGYLLSSTMRNISDVEPTPMLYGFCGAAGNDPFIVSYSGHMVRAERSGVGRLITATTSGQYVTFNDGQWKASPAYLTTVGMCIPSVSTSEILVPGVRLLQFDRDGTFLSVLSDRNSSSALRTDSSTILIGNGTIVSRWANGSIVDSTDVRPLLAASDSIGSGFVGTLLALNDTTVMALVSGVHLYDNVNLVARPYLCGGIVRSTDKGLSWKASTLPDQDPYFLGMIQVSPDILVASYSTVVRDTAKQRSFNRREEQLNETLFTTMQDCHVVLSTDNGETWTKVYSQSASRGFRFIGNSGVRLADGRLIINGIDGPLESFDDGLSWAVHDPGINEATDVITFFTDDAAEDIYYCTTTGVFKNRLVTSSVQGQQLTTSIVQPAEARTWNSHIRAWLNAGYTCTALTGLSGEPLSPMIAPSPGVYIARLTDQNGTVTTRKVMVVE